MIKEDETTEDEKFYKILNKDILLTKQENGKWDLTFEKGDYNVAKGKDSLYNACVIALLTGYNEIGRNDISTYKNFGNKSYELLKQNNNNHLVQYKLQSYFRECLENIHRVKTVSSLNVSASSNNVYAFDVIFSVIGLDDTYVNGNLTLSESYSLTGTNLNLSFSKIIQKVENNYITLTLTDKRGVGIPNQIVNLYIDGEENSTSLTDNNGVAIASYVPVNELETIIYATFNKTKDYKKSQSNTVNVLNLLFNIEIKDNETLYYNYEENYFHPDFSLDENGVLWIDYDTNILKDVYIDENGYLIIEV